jgi:hypothetical protein
MFQTRLTMAVAAIALLAACGSTGTAGGSDVAAPLSSQDVAIPAPALDQSQPVTVNTREDAAGPQADSEDRVIITGMRSALRSGSLDSYLRALSEVSCQGSSTVAAAPSIPLSVTLVAEQSPDPRLRKFGELTFIASYQLTSTDARFGGLSGLDLIADDKLLAVSDAGRFVWIDLNRDGTAPVAARLAPMHEAGGAAMDAAAASEGLAINGSFALVSFEGDHRVLAFDIGRCGASAAGAPIVFGDYGLPLTDAFADAHIEVGEKEGSEPLAVTSDWYLFAGIERKVGQFNSLSGRPIEAEPEFTLRVGVNAPEFAGLDIVPDLRRNGAVRAFLVHRSTASDDSSIVITETDMIRFRDPNAPSGSGEMAERARWRFSETGWRELGSLDRLGTTDSYEGIAAKQLSDGRVRLYLISDDDFDDGKRTLLTILDVPKPLR